MEACSLVFRLEDEGFSVQDCRLGLRVLGVFLDLVSKPAY